MQHLDEGTIHAWLDGALPAAEAARAEAHAAACASCAALVADARGVIARASGILTALDGVPAGVIPGRSAAPPDFAALTARAADAGPADARGVREGPDVRDVRSARSRRWLAPTQLRAAAAVAFVALGGLAVLRARSGLDLGQAAPANESRTTFTLDTATADRATAASAPTASAAPSAGAPGTRQARPESATSADVALPSAPPPPPAPTALARSRQMESDAGPTARTARGEQPFSARAPEGTLAGGAGRVDSAAIGSERADDVLAAPAADLRASGSVVEGRVVDAGSGEPVPGARVLLREPRRSAVTDSTGRFLIADAPPGTHTAEVRRIGYAAATRKVRVRADSAAELRVALETSALGLKAQRVTAPPTPLTERGVTTSSIAVTTEAITSPPSNRVAQDALSGAAAAPAASLAGCYALATTPWTPASARDGSPDVALPALVSLDTVRLGPGTNGRPAFHLSSPSTTGAGALSGGRWSAARASDAAPESVHLHWSAGARTVDVRLVREGMALRGVASTALRDGGVVQRSEVRAARASCAGSEGAPR